MSAQDPRPIASPSQTVGPYFAVGPCPDDRYAVMATADTPGEHITLRIRVLDGDGAPVSDAMVELWQADANGAYVMGRPGDWAPRDSFSGFGRLGTTSDGWCTFETIRPGAFADTTHGQQAPHINVCLFARGLLRHVYTRIYFAGDARLGTDPVLSLVPDDRRSTLLAQPGPDASTWEFIVHLQGDRETVFFEL